MNHTVTPALACGASVARSALCDEAIPDFAGDCFARKSTALAMTGGKVI